MKMQWCSFEGSHYFWLCERITHSVEEICFRSCVSQGSVEKQHQQAICEYLEIYYVRLAHMTVEAKSHNLLSASWRPRETDGVILKQT